jgi:hypothetical protein
MSILAGWCVGVEQWFEQPVLELGVEDGDADAFVGAIARAHRAAAIAVTAETTAATAELP